MNKTTNLHYHLQKKYFEIQNKEFYFSNLNYALDQIFLEKNLNVFMIFSFLLVFISLVFLLEINYSFHWLVNLSVILFCFIPFFTYFIYIFFFKDFKKETTLIKQFKDDIFFYCKERSFLPTEKELFYIQLVKIRNELIDVFNQKLDQKNEKLTLFDIKKMLKEHIVFDKKELKILEKELSKFI